MNSTKVDGLLHSLGNAQKVFLDSAIIIYYVEQHPVYAPLLQEVFERVSEGSLVAVCSAVTLAECLIAPLRQNNRQAYQAFIGVILHARNTSFVSIDSSISQRAAELRVQYNLTLTDAFQVAAALQAGCDAFLTNDRELRRVNEVNIFVLDDFVQTAR